MAIADKPSALCGGTVGVAVMPNLPHARAPMSNPIHVAASLLVGFVVAGFAPPSAYNPGQISDARMAAIVKCTKVAYTRFPGETYEQHRGRYLAYEECMAEAGEDP
jgi:hypothetical protein